MAAIKCSTSLWSADLANLEAEIKRVEPYSERFHLDVADGHFVQTMLFFPDLVQALRAHTSLQFEIHLMATDPLAWIEPFVEAGADGFIFCFDSLHDPLEALCRVRAHGKNTGISLRIKENLDLLEPCFEDLDTLTLLGTDVGIKGASMDPSIPAKIRAAQQLIADRDLHTEVQADGGIRRETVPLMAAAGVDWIVPGSLMFKEDPSEMRQWLAGL